MQYYTKTVNKPLEMESNEAIGHASRTVCYLRLCLFFIYYFIVNDAVLVIERTLHSVRYNP